MNNHDFDFDALLNTFENISDYHAKEIFVIDKIFAFKIFKLTHPEFIDNKYLKSLKLLRKRLFSIFKAERKKQKIHHQSITDITDNVCSDNIFNLSGNNAPTENIEVTRKYIHDKFCSIDLTKSKYIFRSDSDFSLISNVLTDFCAYKHPVLLADVILQPHCKTRLCSILNTIYHRFRNGILNKDTEFLNIVSHLSVFKGLTNGQIATDIMRKNDNFD